MELRDLLASVRRRWWLALIGALLTLGLGVVTILLVSPTYRSVANIVLLPPRTTVDRGGNPYLLLGGLSQPLDVLAVALEDEATLQLIRTVSKSAEVTVLPDVNSSGPILVVTSEASSAAEARNARDVVVREVPTRLADLQEQLNIVQRAQITSMVLTADLQPEILNKDRLRAAVVVVGAGLVGTVLGVALVDGRLLRRRSDADDVEEGVHPVVAGEAGVGSQGDELAAELNASQVVPSYDREQGPTRAASVSRGARRVDESRPGIDDVRPGAWPAAVDDRQREPVAR